MRLSIIHKNIVIIAKEHNPTVLHPHFLYGQEIVDRNHKVVEDRVLCTPAVSRVTFEDGIEFQVQGNRLQIADHQVDVDDIQNDEIALYASQYISALPHVKYTAIGMNFLGLVGMPEPGSYLRDRFLQRGPWFMDDADLSSADIRMHYVLSNKTMQMSLSAGAAHKANESEMVGVLVDVNYHTDLPQESYIDRAKDILRSHSETANDFVVRVHHLFAVE